ncbi:hypothetical protein VZ94_18415 [Methylocucumis oryzae]|uniref:Uncharacterized protein n=1 Tax=Methylocucumis oryzae TaxID=1632867 RepID=A0A0F3IF20_9GAMM|nr:hypothetical protein VZ94_18415 [Methylocucumis oryzae]
MRFVPQRILFFIVAWYDSMMPNRSQPTIRTAAVLIIFTIIAITRTKPLLEVLIKPIQTEAGRGSNF